MISFKEYMLEMIDETTEIDEDFRRFSIPTLVAVINKHKILLSKAVRDGDQDAKKLQLELIRKAENIRRQRSISDFEERRAKAKENRK